MSSTKWQQFCLGLNVLNQIDENIETWIKCYCADDIFKCSLLQEIIKSSPELCSELFFVMAQLTMGQHWHR